MKKGQKVLLCLRLPNPVHGESLISEYITKSQLLNHQFTIEILDIKTSSTIEDIEKLKLNKFFKLLKVYFSFFKTIIIFNPNIIYITVSPTGFAFLKDSLLVIISKIFAKKILIHLHGKGIAIKKNNSSFYSFLYKLVFKNTYCICLSNKLKTDIQGLGVKKIFILNNGISIQQVANISTNINSTIKLLFLSNLIKEKGIYVYLEVCKKLHDLNVSFNANIIGKPFDVQETDIKKFVDDNNLHNKLNYLGAKYGNEKFTLLNEADVLIFPTMYKNEAFPLVLLEAMQFGVVPISTPEGGIADIIDEGKNGFVVPHENIDAIVEKIIFLYKNRQVLLQMAETCRTDFLAKYTLDKFEENILQIFNEVKEDVA